MVSRPLSALTWRAVRDARVRTIAFAYLFALIAYIQPVTYRHAYPTIASRLAFAHSFAHDKAIVLFYGNAYDLLTVGGYSAWRVGGTLAIFAAVFGVLAAVRALRAEEESGRSELVLAGPVGRRTSYGAMLLTVLIGAGTLWLAELAGLVVGGLPAGASAYLGLASASVAVVFAGLGAIASQLAPTRRIALELGGAAVGLFLALRVVADTSSGIGWLRWLTPLGWAEELRPFSGDRPLVLALPVIAAALTLTLAGAVMARRDIGTGLLASSDEADPRTRLLGSATGVALRTEGGGFAGWLVGVGAFALIIGVIANSVSSAGISKPIQRELAKLGSGSILQPAGYLGFTFLFFALALSVFGISQVAAVRHEEAEQRLETLLSTPLSRRGWLGGRLLLAAVAAAAISLVAALLAYTGAASQGVAVSVVKLLEAGANCLLLALLFLSIAALLFAVLPRAGSGLAYGLMTIAFLWQLFGSLLGAPHWLVQVTPFAHIGLVPGQRFRTGDAAVILAVAFAAAVTAVVAFERRDLTAA